MSDITTTITIKLTHARKLEQEEFIALGRNIMEHIEGEHREGIPGFGEISRIDGRGNHQMAGKDVLDDLKWGYSLEREEAENAA